MSGKTSIVSELSPRARVVRTTRGGAGSALVAALWAGRAFCHGEMSRNGRDIDR